MYDEPGIYRDAVAADAGTGLQDGNTRMVICEFYYLPRIDAEAITNFRVRWQGDVYIAKAFSLSFTISAVRPDVGTSCPCTKLL